jgi:hypothetical protein
LTPLLTGAITAIIPGAFTPIRDTWSGRPSRCSREWSNTALRIARGDITPVVGSIDRRMAEVRRIDGVTADLQIRNQAQMTKL